MQQQGTNSLQCPAAVLLNPWLEAFLASRASPELFLKGLDRAAVTHRAPLMGHQLERDWRGTQVAIYDRQMLLLSRIIELLRLLKDPQDH